MAVMFWLGSAAMFILGMLLVFNVLPEMPNNIRDAFILMIAGWLLVINAKLEER